MLSFENITYSRGNGFLFEQLGMTLFPGSALVVQGSNGVGKTSFLRLLAGLAVPDQGQVCWNEVAITDEYDVYCSLISYLGHGYMLKPELTVRQNISFWARVKGVDEIVDAALSYFQLSDKADTVCRVLSAGWKQRVALARVMASPAKCWILDEPTAHLDADGVDRLMNAITIRCREGGIVVLSTHQTLPLKGAIILDLDTQEARVDSKDA